MRDEDRFDLADDYGESHAYYSQQHPATEGLMLQSKLQRALAPALSAVGPSGVKALSGDADGMDDAAVMGVGLGVLQTAFMGALEVVEPDTIKRLLKYTTRDGKKLSDNVAFDVAFKGNYGELFAAIWYVAKFNFGPALQRLMGNERLVAVRNALRRLSEQPEKSSESSSQQTSHAGQPGS